MIFNVFGLKNRLKDLFSEDNVKSLFDLAATAIINKVPSEEEGKAKKAEVDTIVVKFLKEKATSFTGLTRWLVESVLTVVAPVITQLIYNLLKAQVDNLTEKVSK